MSSVLCLLGRIPQRIRFHSPSQKCLCRLLSSENGQNTTVISGSRWRRLWHSWWPIPASVGFTVLAVLQWRRIQRRRSSDYTHSTAKDWQVTCYRVIPCRVASRTWGWISHCHMPGMFRPCVYGLYASLFGVDLDEMAGDLMDYACLGDFFTRGLKEGLRPIDTSDCIVSPADGRVLNGGPINSCYVEQIKGITYKIQKFLGEPSWLFLKSRQNEGMGDHVYNKKKHVQEVKFGRDIDENENEIATKENLKMKTESEWEKKGLLRVFKLSQAQETSSPEDWQEYKKKLLVNPNNELYQMVVYLAPGDYHRFHSPIHWHIKFRRHFQGELLSVNPIIAGWVPDLFSLNERVVYVGEWEHGFFSMTAVGATNVGSINVYCDETLRTNTRKWRDGTKYKDRVMDVVWEKGEEVGEFKMGSTIVLIFEAPQHYKLNVEPNQRIRVGESVICVKHTNRELRNL